MIIVILILASYLNSTNSKNTTPIAKNYEASSYENVTYESLVRTPDNYIGKKIKVSGKVVQLLEKDNKVNLRISVNGDSNTKLLAIYDSKISKIRILENDNVTVAGTSGGIYTYDAKLGGTISIPSMLVDHIELNK